MSHPVVDSSSLQNAIQNEVALELSKVTSDIEVNDVKYCPHYNDDEDGDIGVDDYYYYDHDGEDIEQLAR